MDIKRALDSFEIKHEIVDYYPLGNGHINSTYLCVDNTGKKYVLQKVNNSVFKDVDMLMNNYYKVTEFLHKKGIETIRLVKTKTDKTYIKIDNDIYRLYEYIDNTIWYEEIDNFDLVYNAGKAFGSLHKNLRDFDASQLGEVIPNFHNTPKRYQNLLDAIKEDKYGRYKDCIDELKQISCYERELPVISNAIKKCDIPLAVTHNDPKINNVLFDKDSGKIRAVIDLDTVMPGSYLYDFGDALRSLFTGDNEDTIHLSKLVVNFEIFEAYAKGYLSEMKDVLNEREIELLPFSIFLLTLECGIRFLEDYIRGDVYFRVKKEQHNLIRARTQIRLAQNIYNNLDILHYIIKNILRGG